MTRRPAAFLYFVWTIFSSVTFTTVFAGNFIEESGPGDNIDFGYLTLQFTF